MELADEILAMLRERGLRSTPQRRAIVAEVMGAEGHISPTEVARRVRERVPGVNASTIYRTIDLLEELGVLSHAHLESGAEYHRRAEGNHVHLVCHRCGSDDALDERESKGLARLIGRHRGFKPDLTHFAISGLCARCQKRGRAPARKAAAAVAVCVALLAGCSARGGAANGKITVDSTVAPITDIVRQVVGDRVNLVGLIPEGVDSHTFEPSPQTVRSLSDAAVLFMDGLHLEGSTLKQAQANMPSPVNVLASPGAALSGDATGSEIVRLGDLSLTPQQYAYDFTFPKSKGDPNPHLWMDPTYAARWSEIVRDVMVARDPPNADYYRENQRRFAGVIATLDHAIATAVPTIPAMQRKLLTYHDSFAYFGRRYGMQILGAVQPNDFSEPSPREVARLIDQVKANHVPAIFGSEVFPSTVLAQVAREAHAQYVDKLRDDELPGKPGDQNHTYVGMIVEDVSVMVKALGGDPAAVDAVAVAATWKR